MQSGEVWCVLVMCVCFLYIVIAAYKTICVPKEKEKSFYARPFYPRLTVSKVTIVHN